MDEIKSDAELQVIMRAPIAVIFKHSTQCPISANADKEVREFLTVHAAAPIHLVDVLARRAISDEIERLTKLKHESPQVIVLQHGVPVWHASHYAITSGELEQALVDFQ